MISRTITFAYEFNDNTLRKNTEIQYIIDALAQSKQSDYNKT